MVVVEVDKHYIEFVYFVSHRNCVIVIAIVIKIINSIHIERESMVLCINLHVLQKSQNVLYSDFLSM